MQLVEDVANKHRESMAKLRSLGVMNSDLTISAFPVAAAQVIESEYFLFVLRKEKLEVIICILLVPRSMYPRGILRLPEGLHSLRR